MWHVVTWPSVQNVQKKKKEKRNRHQSLLACATVGKSDYENVKMPHNGDLKPSNNRSCKNMLLFIAFEFVNLAFRMEPNRCCILKFSSDHSFTQWYLHSRHKIKQSVRFPERSSTWTMASLNSDSICSFLLSNRMLGWHSQFESPSW